MPTETQQPGQAIPTSPLGRIVGIHCVTAGTWNNRTVTDEDMQAMAANFREYSGGPTPYYTPFVSINHEDKLACGMIDDVRLVSDGIEVDASNVPEDVGRWWNEKRLHSPSVEFWFPERDSAGVIIDGFRKPDGEFSETPVLKCVTLLGSEAPAVKGLRPMPVATFSDAFKSHNPKLLNFEDATMSRDEMITALVAMGWTAEGLALWPDSLLQEAVEKKIAPNAPATPATGDGTGTSATGDPPPVMPMSDLAVPSGVSVPTIGGGSPPTSLTVKFSDAAGRQQTGTIQLPKDMVVLQSKDVAILNSIARNNAALVASMQRQSANAKATAIAAFADRCRAAKIAPVTIAAYEKVLANLDHTNVVKFSDGSRTALEQGIRDLEVGIAPALKAGEVIKATAGHTTATPGTSNGDDWEARRRAIMGQDPLFKHKLNVKK